MTTAKSKSTSAEKSASKKKAETIPAKPPRSRTRKPLATIEAVIPALQVTAGVTPAPTVDVHDEDTPQEPAKTTWLPIGIWDKTKVLWAKYAWVVVVVLLITVIIFILVDANRGKSNRAVKEAQQNEKKIEDDQAASRKSIEQLNVIVDSMQKLSVKHEAYEETMRDLNLQYKKLDYEIQSEIKDSAFNNDSRRRLVRELSGQK